MYSIKVILPLALCVRVDKRWIEQQYQKVTVKTVIRIFQILKTSCQMRQREKKEFGERFQKEGKDERRGGKRCRGRNMGSLYV